MTSAGQDHYCFIIHDNLPYCYDINSILALPVGFHYRNRFRKDWVEGNLHDHIDSMIGQDVLIILRVQQMSLLIPVRWGTIKVAQQVGSIYYFEYLLGDLVAYPSDADDREKQIARATRLFQDNHVWLPGTPGEMLHKPSVFRSTTGSQLDRAKANDSTAWGNSVGAVTTAPIFEKAEFLDVLGLFDLKNRPSPVQDEDGILATAPGRESRRDVCTPDLPWRQCRRA